MKKLTAALMCLCAVLCGCNAEPITEIQIARTVSGENVIIETPDTMYLGESVYAIGTCPVTSSAVDDQGQAIFTQSYQKFRFYLDNNQAQAAIEADLQNRMNQFFAEAGTLQAQAREDCFSTEDWLPYYCSVRYTPARIDEAVISLYATYEGYNGTAPSESVSCVTYDAISGDVLYLDQILEPTCTGSLLAQKINAQLTSIDGLYPEYQDTVKEVFQSHLSGFSNWYLDHQGLCVYFSPYEISPVSVQIIVPYGLLDGILLEQFLPTSPEPVGNLSADHYMEEQDAERFSFLAELTLQEDGSPIVIYPNATITGLRIESGWLSSDGAVYTPESTIFAADAFYAGNAVVITAGSQEDAPVLRVSYFSGNQQVSATVLYSPEDGSVILAYG